LFIFVVFCRSVPENYIEANELKLNTEAESMYEEEEEEEHDEDEEEMMAREEKTMKKKKKSNRQRWTKTEIEELQIYFKQFLDTGTTPRRAFIDKMKKKIEQNGGVVHLRDSHLIIKKISNMNALKRQK
jgi:hypothetical protein